MPHSPISNPQSPNPNPDSLVILLSLSPTHLISIIIIIKMPLSHCIAHLKVELDPEPSKGICSWDGSNALDDIPPPGKKKLGRNGEGGVVGEVSTFSCGRKWVMRDFSCKLLASF